jgi:hypothetical protein
MYYQRLQAQLELHLNEDDVTTIALGVSNSELLSNMQKCEVLESILKVCQKDASVKSVVAKM